MTATYPARTGLRPCRLYRFYVTHPITGREVLGYVGETGRQPFQRLLEHLTDQPWFDTVTRWEIDPQVYYGKAAVLEAETAAIRAEKPLYNVKMNELNVDRIIPPVAIRQRRERDAKNNEARWVHPDDRGVQLRPDRPAPVRQQRPVRKPWQQRLVTFGKNLALRLAIWAGSTLTFWLLALHWHLGGWRQTLTASALLLPTFLLVVLLAMSRTATKRTRRRFARRLSGWPR